MTPVERAKALLGDSWIDDLESHLLHGYVHSTPDAFVMARPCPMGADVCDAWEQWPREQCNCLYLWICVGSLDSLLPLMPPGFDYIGRMRLGRDWKEIRWTPISRLGGKFGRKQA